MVKTADSSSSTKSSENRRTRSTEKEKRRNDEIKEALHHLQKQLPHVPHDSKLPRIKTLRLALKYIEHLNQILTGDKMIQTKHMNNPRPLAIDDFAAIAMTEMQVRNSYTERMGEEEVLSPSPNMPSTSNSVPMMTPLHHHTSMLPLAPHPYPPFPTYFTQFPPQ